MWLVAGLGNPGPEYAKTRHNIGFMVVDRLAARAGDIRFSKQFKGEAARIQLRAEPTILLKPVTYMNLSGDSVQPAAAYFKVPTEQVIVVHDDIDLEMGQIKIKVGGGHGGHNGIRSVAQRMGPNFFRIRLGVGRPGGRGDKVVGHVLGGFSSAEQVALEELVDAGCDAVESLMSQGLLPTQNRFHTRGKKEEKPKKSSRAKAPPRADES